MLSSTSTLAIDFNAFAAAQRENTELHHLQSAAGLLTFHEVPSQRQTPPLCVTLQRDSHAISFLRHSVIVFDTFHSAVHPGIQATS